MYVHPFVCGVVATLLAEIIGCIIYAAVTTKKKVKEEEPMKKSELIAEIEKTKAEHEEKLAGLHEQIKVEAMKERHLETAKEVKSVYDSYVEAGFTEEQAWEIVTILLKK